MSASIVVTSEQFAPTQVNSGVFPASEVEARLVAALRDLDAARQNAVIWFGEILSPQALPGVRVLEHPSLRAVAAGVLAGAHRLLPAALPVL